MPKVKYDQAIKEQWYKQYYEKKMTANAIADKYDCDARTVRTGIDEVRMKMNANAAEVDLIKDAMTKHQMDLIDTIEHMKLAAKMREIIEAPVKWVDKDDFGETISTRLAELDKENMDPIDEMLGNKYRGKLDLLSQHIRGEPLWRSFLAWKKADYKMERAQLELQALLVTLLLRNFKLESSFAGNPYVLTKYICPRYYNTAVAMALGKPHQEIKKDWIVADNGSILLLKEAEIAIVPQRDESLYVDLLYLVWENLNSSQELATLAASYHQLVKTSTTLEKQADGLMLSHYVPGRCRACKIYRQ